MQIRYNLTACLAFTLVLSSLHGLVNPAASGNLFPMANYPQSLEWYVYSLEQAILKALLFGLIWWLVAFIRKLVRAGLEVQDERLQQAAEAIGSNAMHSVALIFFLFELKEIPEYLIWANQLSSAIDYLILGGLVLFTLIRSRKSG